MSSTIRGAALMAGAAACMSVLGCSTDSETPAETTTTHAAQHITSSTTPTHGRSDWSGNGAFSVGAQPSGDAKGAIPPGRYTVELMPGSTVGYWVRCSALPCSMTSTNNIVDLGKAEGRGFSATVDVLPTDGAVYLEGVVFR